MRGPIDTADHLGASLWRKLLAVRLIALCLVGLAVSFYIMDWYDKAKPDLPQFLEWIFAICVVAQFFSLLYALRAGIPDLVVHFVPEGRFKRLLLWGDQSGAEIAGGFRRSGYQLALLPFLIPIGIAGLALALLLAFGGVALVMALFGALFDAIFAGWPPWAVVITLLLVAILAKR